MVKQATLASFFRKSGSGLKNKNRKEPKKITTTSPLTGTGSDENDLCTTKASSSKAITSSVAKGNSTDSNVDNSMECMAQKRKNTELVDTDDEDIIEKKPKIRGNPSSFRAKFNSSKKDRSDKEVKDVKRDQRSFLDESSDEEMEESKSVCDDDNNDEEYKEDCFGSEHEDEEFVGDSDTQDLDVPIKSLKTIKRKEVSSSNSMKQFKNAFAKQQQPKSKTKSKASAVAASTLSDAKLTSDNKSWIEGTPITYSILCSTLSDIEAITSRLEIQKHLTDLFRLCLLKCPNDLITLVYLASNSVAPAFECVELGIGDAVLIKAVGEASGTNPSIIKKRYEADGDLGTVAMRAKGKQKTLGFGIKPKPLMAKEVLSVFRQIATTTGNQSQKWKVDKIKGLLVRVQDPKESKYIIRGLQGKMRIGLAQSTVLTSLAHAILLSRPTKESDRHDQDDTSSDNAKQVEDEKISLELRLESSVNIVKKAYSEVPSFDTVVAALLDVPLSQLHKECTLRPGLPVEPMLAKPTKSIQEVLKRLSGKRFTCEYKYDGERAQVHMNADGVTKVFSRSLLDTSEKFPEVPLYVKEACDKSDVKSFVLDTEVVAYNREKQQFVPFQVLSTRKKTEESEENAKVKIIVQAFDLMYLNGKSLLDHTLSDRRDLMKKYFKAVDGKFQFATSHDHTEDGDTTVLEEFLDAAVKGQCEGLMVKTLDENASYQPSYRSLNWLKLKKDYLEGMGDSVDLVPIGAYHGRGKRTGVYGAYLLACYDLDTEEYQSVCKIGTGFSDENLKSLSKTLNEKVISEKSTQYNVSPSLECDVWFDVCQVWEVKAADLSKSSTHKGAVDKTGESGRGIGLRFPRFERVRDDKRPDQATSSDQILDMYYAQDSVVNQGGGHGYDGI